MNYSTTTVSSMQWAAHDSIISKQAEEFRREPRFASILIFFILKTVL